MKAGHFAAIAVAALSTTAAAAQDQLSPDEQIFELKRELVLLWADMASDPTCLRRTPEWRAIRSQYVELQKGLRDLDRRHGQSSGSSSHEARAEAGLALDPMFAPL